jgi:hypothetical protein
MVPRKSFPSYRANTNYILSVARDENALTKTRVEVKKISEITFSKTSFETLYTNIFIL